VALDPVDTAVALQAGGAMTEMAETLLKSCDRQQIPALLRAWDDEDRTTWFYTPTAAACRSAHSVRASSS
jgi:hypothetical protein